jgi:hypothetical protein
MDTPVAIGNHPGARTLSHVCEALA